MMRRCKSHSQNEEHHMRTSLPKKGSSIARALARSAAMNGGKPRISGGAACLTMTLLAGCAVGPDFLELAAPDVTGYTK
jgi:hypothetical protein